MQRSDFKIRLNKPAFKVAEKPMRRTWMNTMKEAKRSLSCHMEIAAGQKKKPHSDIRKAPSHAHSFCENLNKPSRQDIKKKSSDIFSKNQLEFLCSNGC